MPAWSIQTGPFLAHSVPSANFIYILSMGSLFLVPRAGQRIILENSSNPRNGHHAIVASNECHTQISTFSVDVRRTQIHF